MRPSANAPSAERRPYATSRTLRGRPPRRPFRAAAAALAPDFATPARRPAARRTVAGDSVAVERWARTTAADHGFVEVDHLVEVVGTCASCAASRS